MYVGRGVGIPVGVPEGSAVGTDVGVSDGGVVGTLDGTLVGVVDGSSVGLGAVTAEQRQQLLEQAQRLHAALPRLAVPPPW